MCERDVYQIPWTCFGFPAKHPPKIGLRAPDDKLAQSTTSLTQINVKQNSTRQSQQATTTPVGHLSFPLDLFILSPTCQISSDIYSCSVTSSSPLLRSLWLCPLWTLEALCDGRTSNHTLWLSNMVFLGVAAGAVWPFIKRRPSCSRQP